MPSLDQSVTVDRDVYSVHASGSSTASYGHPEPRRMETFVSFGSPHEVNLYVYPTNNNDMDVPREAYIGMRYTREELLKLIREIHTMLASQAARRDY